MTYRFLAPAKADLAQAVRWYDEAVPGLGLDFLDEVDNAIRRILLQPEAWTRIGPVHRRCRLRRFPFGIIYALEESEILVAAVMDLRRHPDSWKHPRK